jgi:hypothetical protein
MKKNYSIVCLVQTFRTFIFAFMNQKTSNFRFSDFPGKVSLAILLLAVFVVPAFSQNDDDVIAGKVLDAGNRQIGKAELILTTKDVKINFDYDIKIWLDGGSRLRIVRPNSGSRSSTINCSFSEYKVDSNNPKDDSRWEETGSGTASLKMPASGDVQKITASMTLTKKVVGDDEVAVNHKPQKFVIAID